MNNFIIILECDVEKGTKADGHRLKLALEQLKSTMKGWGNVEIYNVQDDKGFARAKDELRQSAKR